MNESANILLVEDDKNMRITLTALLEEQTHHVRACQSAEEGLIRILAKDPPIEIVISDLNLPDGSGLQILWPLKKVTPDAAFILITGHASLETAIAAVNEGVFAYHVKPLDLDALNGSVRNARRQQCLVAENRDLLEAVQRSNGDLEAKNRELEALSRAKSQILSTVSHELKTPLTNIACYIDRMIIQRDMVGPLNERQQSYLEIVQENSRRLKGLIDDLLDVSRIEAGSLELHLTELDVGQKIEQVVRSMGGQINAKQMDVRTQIPPSLPRVRADGLRFSQIVGNLLNNACKYSPVAATTTITAKEQDGYIQIDIRDTGIGISKDDQSRLFTKFFRASNPMNHEVSGTGLGLFITRRIVEAHGGRVWVESDNGGGSTFSFTLPRTRADVMDKDSPVKMMLPVKA